MSFASSELSTRCQESGRSCSHPLHHLHLSALLQHEVLSSSALHHHLRQRERLLCAGTLSTTSILLILAEAVMQGVSLSSALLCHDATLTAAQKQQVMPPGVLVQKTLSLQFSDPSRTLTLVTGPGDYSLTPRHRHALADALSISGSDARRSTINPPGCNPVTLFGMEPGMITPFLASRQPPISALGLLLPEPVDPSVTHVAISLSLCESLLVPVTAFVPLLERYVTHMFAHVRLFRLHEQRVQSSQTPWVLLPQTQSASAAALLPVR